MGIFDQVKQAMQMRSEAKRMQSEIEGYCNKNQIAPKTRLRLQLIFEELVHNALVALVDPFEIYHRAETFIPPCENGTSSVTRFILTGRLSSTACSRLSSPSPVFALILM